MRKKLEAKRIKAIYKASKKRADFGVQTYKWVFFPMRFKNSLN